jgi:hypothetical protein
MSRATAETCSLFEIRMSNFSGSMMRHHHQRAGHVLLSSYVFFQKNEPYLIPLSVLCALVPDSLF